MTRNTSAARVACLLPLALFLSGCGQGPRPVEPAPQPRAPMAPGASDGTSAAGPLGPESVAPNDSLHAGLGRQQHSADDGHDHGPSEGMGHTDAPMGEKESFSGVVRLQGALAKATTGFLFVSIMPAGTNAPVAFDRFALSDATLGTAGSGERVIPFSYPSTPTPAGALELKVQYDSDGYVETKDEHTRVGRFGIERGGVEIDVVLDGDDPAFGAPAGN